MHRGKPEVMIYTLALPEGQYLQYPDAELWTLDEDEARSYAKEKGYQLIGTPYVADDTGEEMLDDFRPFNWHAETPDIIDGGDVGGDNQAGTAWQIRLVSDVVPNSVMDVYVFAEAVMTEQTGEFSGEYKVTVMTQYTVYDNRADPDDTETWSDTRFNSKADPHPYYDGGRAENEARSLATRYAADPSSFEWNGEPF